MDALIGKRDGGVGSRGAGVGWGWGWGGDRESRWRDVVMEMVSRM